MVKLTVNLKLHPLQMAFFFDPDEDCVVECLKSCCSDSFPPRYHWNCPCGGILR